MSEPKRISVVRNRSPVRGSLKREENQKREDQRTENCLLNRGSLKQESEPQNHAAVESLVSMVQ